MSAHSPLAQHQQHYFHPTHNFQNLTQPLAFNNTEKNCLIEDLLEQIPFHSTPRERVESGSALEKPSDNSKKEEHSKEDAEEVGNSTSIIQVLELFFKHYCEILTTVPWEQIKSGKLEEKPLDCLESKVDSSISDIEGDFKDNSYYILQLQIESGVIIAFHIDPSIMFEELYKDIKAADKTVTIAGSKVGMVFKGEKVNFLVEVKDFPDWISYYNCTIGILCSDD